MLVIFLILFLLAAWFFLMVKVMLELLSPHGKHYPTKKGAFGLYYLCTSKTRPENPQRGLLVYETDTNTYAYFDGEGWIPERA